MPEVSSSLVKVNNRSPVQVPGPVRRQLAEIPSAFTRILGKNLVSVVLHGSLATSGFDPRRSDIDLLVVTRRPMSGATRRRMIVWLLRHSHRPAPIEFSIVARRDLVPWNHPTTFDFHWSEAHRDAYDRELRDGSFNRRRRERPRDPDLAAHVVMARTRGRALCGLSPTLALPDIPIRDAIDSLVSDGAWARRLLRRDPGMMPYAILNAVRRLALVRHGWLLSKSEGADWGRGWLAPRWRGTLAAARANGLRPRSRDLLNHLGRLESGLLRSVRSIRR
jgi:streptomycin 3"-adenylyltransferase